MVKQWNLTDFTNLHQARHLLSKKNRKTLGLLMPVDVYVQDPQVAESNYELAIKEILVECEPELMAGPVSARIAVVDYDADTKTLEPPVQWDRRRRRFYFEQNGERIPITRDHRDLPQFHQVNVWAVVQSVLRMYEASWVLGRSAPWAFDGNRLIVKPHAGYKANAFYDRRARSLLFHYCGPNDKRVYTCLSHDIIAHETGHAILDGLRPLYYGATSLQTAAFHEFVADLTAIVISLLNNELRWEVAQVSEGDLSRDTIVAALAKEFGHYTSGRGYLRSATNTRTIAQVRDQISPYPWSEVLTGAMWDILAGLFARYRIKPKSDTRKLPTDREAMLWAVNDLRRIALQPLDYLPPVDVQFSDYAHAVLHVDELVNPVDEDDCRGLMRDVLTQRGIDFAKARDQAETPRFYAYDIDRVSRSRTDAYHFLHENRRQLCIPPDQDFSVVDLYRTDKTLRGGGKLPREIVLQYVWREPVPLTGPEFGPWNGRTVSLLCGGTIVFDERGNVRYWTRKPGTGSQKVHVGRRREYCAGEHARGVQRRKQLLAYIARGVAGGHIGLAEDQQPDESEARVPIVAQSADDGTLWLQTLPGMRHWRDDRDVDDGRD